MNIDEKIRQELLDEAAELDAILKNDAGLFERILATLQSNMRYWMIFITLIVAALSAIMIYCGYRFFTANEPQQLVFWGICTLGLLIIQAVTKLWIFIEANRQSTYREIKRVELAVERLERYLTAS